MGSFNHSHLAIAAAAGVLSFATAAASQETITIAGHGGNLQNDMMKTFWEPAATAANLELREETRDGLAAVRVQVQSGNPAWDVVQLAASECAIGGKEGLFEPLDYKTISTEGFDKQAYGEHWIATNTYSVVLAWSTDVYKDNPPKNWKDLWDYEKFPGTRALGTEPTEMLEIALLADGVEKDSLYPLDTERALASIEKISPEVSVWWSTGAQSAQLLKDGEVDMMAIWGSRVLSVIEDGAPVDFTCQDAILGYGCLVIPKGASNVTAAQKFIAAAVSPEIQARIPEMMPYYGPANKLAFDVKEFPPEVLAKSNMAPENFKKQVSIDPNWWRDNYEVVSEDYSLMMSY